MRFVDVGELLVSSDWRKRSWYDSTNVTEWKILDISVRPLLRARNVVKRYEKLKASLGQRLRVTAVKLSRYMKREREREREKERGMWGSFSNKNAPTRAVSL